MFALITISACWKTRVSENVRRVSGRKSYLKFGFYVSYIWIEKDSTSAKDWLWVFLQVKTATKDQFYLCFNTFNDGHFYKPIGSPTFTTSKRVSESHTDMYYNNIINIVPPTRYQDSINSSIKGSHPPGKFRRRPLIHPCQNLAPSASPEITISAKPLQRPSPKRLNNSKSQKARLPHPQPSPQIRSSPFASANSALASLELARAHRAPGTEIFMYTQIAGANSAWIQLIIAFPGETSACDTYYAAAAGGQVEGDYARRAAAADRLEFEFYK